MTKKFSYTFLILISFSPILLAYFIGSEFAKSSIYKVLVLAIYVLQVVYFILNVELNRWNVRKKVMVIILFLLFSSIMKSLVNFLLGFDINAQDLADIVFKTLCIMIYYNIPSRVNIQKQQVIKIFEKLILFVIIACLFNLLINAKNMAHIASQNVYSLNFKSFYLNRNSFAQLTFFGTCISIFLYIEKPTYKKLMVTILIFLNLFLTFSRTSILCTLIFLVVFINLNKKIKVTYKVGVIFILFFMLIIIINSSSVIEIINNYFIRKEAGLANRGDIWIDSLQSLHVLHYVFGIGFNTASALLLKPDYGVHEFHSFYLETILNGGIIELLVYITIIIELVKKYINNFRIENNLSCFYISFTLAVLIYGIVESISFFTVGYVGTLFTIIVISIPTSFFSSCVSNKKLVQY